MKSGGGGCEEGSEEVNVIDGRVVAEGTLRRTVWEIRGSGFAANPAWISRCLPHISQPCILQEVHVTSWSAVYILRMNSLSTISKECHRMLSVVLAIGGQV